LKLAGLSFELAELPLNWRDCLANGQKERSAFVNQSKKAVRLHIKTTMDFDLSGKSHHLSENDLHLSES
jgi:hypothetical protein